jgi:hypothetical protein
MDGGKLTMGLKTIVNQWTFRYGIIKNSSLRISLLMLFYMYVNFRDAVSLENCGER